MDCTKFNYLCLRGSFIIVKISSNLNLGNMFITIYFFMYTIFNKLLKTCIN